jgi:hypothetical protein
MSQENIETASRFKSNFTNLLADLSDTMQAKPEIVAGLQVLKKMVQDCPAPFLIRLFLDHINERLTPESTTLLEDFNEGKFFSVLRAFLDKIPVSDTLKLGSEIDFMSFDDDDKDMYVNYLQSFFRQGSKYVV